MLKASKEFSPVFTANDQISAAKFSHISTALFKSLEFNAVALVMDKAKTMAKGCDFAHKVHFSRLDARMTGPKSIPTGTLHVGCQLELTIQFQGKQESIGTLVICSLLDCEVKFLRDAVIMQPDDDPESVMLESLELSRSEAAIAFRSQIEKASMNNVSCKEGEGGMASETDTSTSAHAGSNVTISQWPSTSPQTATSAESQPLPASQPFRG